MFYKYSKIIFSVFVATLLVLPLFAFAQFCIGGFCDNTGGICTIDADCGVGLPGGVPITLNDVALMIGSVANFLIYTSTVIAVVMIIWGGIMYMTAGGNDTKAATARTIIKNGIIGAAVVLGVGVILQTVTSVINRGFFLGF
jgi:hypothetical protein